MKNYDDISDYFEDYLNGNLGQEQALLFEERLGSDPGFKQELETHQLIDDIFVSNGTRNIKDEVLTLFQEKKKAIKKRRIKIALGVLIILLSGLFIMVWKKPDSSASENVLHEKGRNTTPIESKSLSDYSRSTNENDVSQYEKAETNSQYPQELGDVVRIDDSAVVKVEEIDSLPENQYVQVDTLLVDSKTEKTNLTPSIVETTSCVQRPSVETKTNPSCEFENNGSLQFMVSGGKAPYTYYVNEISYDSQSKIEDLGTGYYSVYVIDADLCSTDTLTEVYVAQKFCAQMEKAFRPATQNWEVSFEEEVRLEIRNYLGQIVFEEINNEFSWDGRDQTGADLATGSYLIYVYKNNQLVQKGNVSIFR